MRVDFPVEDLKKGEMKNDVRAKLAERFKASVLRADSFTRSWVRIPHLANKHSFCVVSFFIFFLFSANHIYIHTHQKMNER